MAGGGSRQGAPATAYPNRTDLNTNKITPSTQPTGQPYGQRKANEQALAALPIPNGAADSVVPLSAPTTQPDQPVTAGLPFGPGPGPEALGGTGQDDVAIQLRSLYRLYPDENIARLIDLYEAGY